MAFIRFGNQTVSFLLFSFFLSLLFNNAHSAYNNYNQFGILDNTYSQTRAPYKPLPPTPSDILFLQRYSDRIDHFDISPIRFGLSRPLYEQQEINRYSLQERNYYEQLAEQEKIESEKKEIEREHLRAHLRKIVTNTLAKQAPEIRALIDQTNKVHKQITFTESPATHLAARIKYLQKYLDNPHSWYDDFYRLSTEESTFLDQHACSAHFDLFYGNHLQHGIHKEHITIISRATVLEKNSGHNPSKIKICSFIVKALETAHTHKVQGNIFTSLEINDVCYHLLDPTEQRGYLAPQLALVKTRMARTQSTDLEKAFECLESASQEDAQLASCLRAASKYEEQFIKTGRDYELQVLEIVTEMSLNEFANIPIEEQFEFLEEHHEGIAIKALRIMNSSAIHNAQTTDYATKILNIDTPQTFHNTELLKTLLNPNDSLTRTKRLTITPYHSSGQGVFFCKDGILHEHAMLRDLHRLPLPAHNKLAPETHEFLHTYHTSKNTNEKELAYYGLFHQTQASINSSTEHMHGHELLAHEYYATLYNNKQSNLPEWSNTLARTYTDPHAQEVHNELIWVTHQFITADSKASARDSVTERILNEINYMLTDAHAYNQLNQPAASHELLKNITDVFGSSAQRTQDKSLFYQGLNLAQTTANIGNNLNTSIDSLKEILDNSGATPDEKIAQARQELARLHIQSGKLVRDNSQLSQKELDNFSERMALQPSRHPVKQTLINKLAKQAMLEFDTKFPQFKKNLNHEDYSAHKKKYVHTYYERYKKKASTCPERTLDNLTKQIDPTIASIKAADTLGFIIHQNNSVIDIEYVPENTLRGFKEVWPSEDVIENIIQLWDNEIPLCAINKQQAARERYDQREAAYYETQNAPSIFVEKSYTISHESQKLLQKNDIEYDHLIRGTYNPLQDQLHTELLEILEQTTLLDAQDSVGDLLRPCNTMMLDFVSTAAYANQQGDIIKTMTLADFCWGTLDCGQAIFEGLKDGTYDTFRYAYDHPLETILFTVAGNYMLYYQIGKLSYELTNLAIESYLSGLQENPKPKKPLFFRDMVKAAAYFGAQMASNYAINYGVTKCIQAGFNELSPLVDKLVAEEASALAHDHAPQLSRPREIVQLITEDGEIIEMIMPHENFNNAGNNIPTKPTKGARATKPNHYQQNSVSKVESKETIVFQDSGFPAQKNKVFPKPLSHAGKDSNIGSSQNNKIPHSGNNLQVDSSISNLPAKWLRNLEKNKARMSEVAKAIENKPQKLERIEKQHANTAANIEEASKCLIHKYDEGQKNFEKYLAPFDEILFKKYGIRVRGIDLYHHMERDINKTTKEFSGFHSNRNHPEHVFKRLEGPNEHGFAKIIVGNSRKIKSIPSTIYPEQWDENIIGQKVIEALITGKVDSIRKDGTLIIVGTAQNYIAAKGLVPCELTIMLPTNGMIRSSWPKFE